MKVTQEKLPSSQIGLEIEIPAEMSQKTYEKVIKDLSNSASIPGFRKGKVPRPILLQRLGITRIKGTTLEELIQKCLQHALEQESIKAIGNFQLRSSFDELLNLFEPGKPLTFSAAVDVPPEVTLGDYKGLNVKAEEVLYDPSKVDKFLEERRIEQATLIPVEGRPAQMGDTAMVDYIGKFAPVEGSDTATNIEGAEATDFQLELSEGRFIQEIIDGVVGMNVGDTKEVSVSFPADYAREDLAGKSTLFTITLKELKEKDLPPLDDDLAQEVSDFETLAELRESLESRFREQAEQATANNKEQALVAELVKLVEVDFPESMIQSEIEALMTQTVMQLSQMGMDVKSIFTEEMVRELQSRSRPEAIQRLKQSSALQEVVKRESLSVEAAELAAKIAEVREQLTGRDVNEERLREVVESDLLKEKAVKLLESLGSVELVPEGSLKSAEEEPMAEEDTTIDVSVVEAETPTP